MDLNRLWKCDPGYQDSTLLPAFKLRTNACLTALLCVVCLLLPLSQSANGAGVTIITHGYECGGGLPPWVSAMASGVVARAGGPQNCAFYNMVLGEDASGDPAVLVSALGPNSGSPNAGAANSGEIVIALDWSAFSGAFANP